ncbi:MAG: pyridoxamine 5-phosphate oxidase [Firmicutes bacterium]|nr:pyridoxamine 5-phosphate oxidase [Bacillota bacterium]
MNEVLKFLTDNPVFYFATVDKDKPKVRPFAFVMIYEGKLWFCTNNQKDVYKQLQANPYFEICTTAPDKKWIRLKGKAVFNSTPAVKAKALEVAPELKNMYSVDDSIFEVFYVAEGEATFYSLTGEIKTIKL